MAECTSYRPQRPPCPGEIDVVARRSSQQRSPAQFRPVLSKVGVVTRAVGSAYVEAGATKIICAVYGPRQTERAQFSEKGRLKCDLRYTSCTAPDPERYRRTTEEKEPSQQIHRALEVCVRLDKYPKSVIDLFVLVLDSDGGTLPFAIMCGSLALAHAGIEMFDLVAACTVVSIDRQLLIDPTEEEEVAAALGSTSRDKSGCSVGGSVMMATMPSLSRVTQIVQTGELETEELMQMTRQCEEGCQQVLRGMRSALCTNPV